MSVTHSTPSVPVPSRVLRQIDLYNKLHFAIENEQPLVILYATKGVEVKARVIVPYDLYEARNGRDIVRAHDNAHEDIISLRVDWIRSAAHLTMV